MINDSAIIDSVRRWVESFVVELNLCPFARHELVNERIRFVLTRAQTEEALLNALQTELELLSRDDSIGTTLLIHAEVLQNFDHYNQFLSVADQLLHHMALDGVYQVASFHPDYQFAGTNPNDAQNYTNRSPYPVLHLLREESVTQAVDRTPGIDRIPLRNISLMNRMGKDRLELLLQSCIYNAGEPNQ